MNAYSYNPINQDAFGLWFDAIPADTKKHYLALLESGDTNSWAYPALDAGQQAAGWIDALHDSLYVWGQETGTLDAIRKNEYNFDRNISTPLYTIEIDTKAQYGYFEHNELGDEKAGGLWFDGDRLSDYDGVYELPRQVTAALINSGYQLEDI
jgi:hypothetical protein